MMAEANAFAEALEIGSIAAKEHIPQHAMRYTSEKAFDGASLVSINREDHHWCLDVKVVNEFAGLGFIWIVERASRTDAAHTGDVGVHFRQIKLEANAIKTAVRVKMSTNGIEMKGNKEDVAKLRWNEL